MWRPSTAALSDNSQKNTVWAALMEDLKGSGLQEDPSDHYYASEADVDCDLCTRKKTKAVKSCLVCLVSFCEKHVRSHYQVSGLKRHNLVEPTAHLQDKVCPLHNEAMKIFCLQDRQGICYLCAIDEHKGHDTVSAQVGRNERQKDILGHQKSTQDRIQRIGDDIKALEAVIEATNWSADEAVQSVEEIFDQLIHCIEGKRTKFKEQIRTKHKSEVDRVVVLQDNMEHKLTEMKRILANLDHLARTENHIYVLQNYPQNFGLNEYRGLTNRDAQAVQYFKNVTGALSKIQGKLDVFLNIEMFPFSIAVADVDVLLLTKPPQPSCQPQPPPKSNPSKLRLMTRQSSTSPKPLPSQSNASKKRFFK